MAHTHVANISRNLYIFPLPFLVHSPDEGHEVEASFYQIDTLSLIQVNELRLWRDGRFLSIYEYYYFLRRIYECHDTNDKSDCSSESSLE